jgi:hypothetical protein
MRNDAAAPCKKDTVTFHLTRDRKQIRLATKHLLSAAEIARHFDTFSLRSLPHKIAGRSEIGTCPGLQRLPDGLDFKISSLREESYTLH